MSDKESNVVPTEIYYLSIDPGKHNGCCGYDYDFNLVFMITIKADDIVDFLARDDLKTVRVCIVEDYKVYPNKARQHIYSNLETSRVIGRVETWCKLSNIKLIKQMAHIKATGYMYLGKKPLPKSNPRNHEFDAHAHAVYWGVVNGKLSPRQLLQDKQSERP